MIVDESLAICCPSLSQWKRIGSLPSAAHVAVALLPAIAWRGNSNGTILGFAVAPS